MLVLLLWTYPLSCFFSLCR